MFTGLVEAKVPLIETLVEGTGKRMGFDLGTVSDGVRIGDSIALNGCCLTVIAIQGTQGAGLNSEQKPLREPVWAGWGLPISQIASEL